jgi:hypothetical protein
MALTAGKDFISAPGVTPLGNGGFGRRKLDAIATQQIVVGLSRTVDSGPWASVTGMDPTRWQGQDHLAIALGLAAEMDSVQAFDDLLRQVMSRMEQGLMMDLQNCARLKVRAGFFGNYCYASQSRHGADWIGFGLPKDKAKAWVGFFSDHPLLNR